jgi:hypothetical protein
VDLLDQAERYEVICDVYQMILPIYQRNRDYEELARAYGTMHQACKKIVEVSSTGRRLLGTYFRVGFYGKVCFISFFVIICLTGLFPLVSHLVKTISSSTFIVNQKSLHLQ